MVDRLVGDQVIGLYVPGFAGRRNAELAIKSAQQLLHKTGHTDPDGPWVGVGVGVLTDY